MYQEYRPGSFQILPLVVKNLLIINSLVFFLTNVLYMRFGIDLTESLGLHYFTSDKFRVHQLVTHLFMHGSFMHLFSNMFALWMFGNMLENRWGSKRFLIFYLFTGLGASLVHLGYTGLEVHRLQQAIQFYVDNGGPVDFKALIVKYNEYIGQNVKTVYEQIYEFYKANPESEMARQESIKAANHLLQYKLSIPTVGASGAVFGVLLAFGMLFPNTIIFVYFLFPLKAKYLVALYGLFELYTGFASTPGDNVAHFAHLGGMLFGFILIKIWNKYNRNRFY